MESHEDKIAFILEIIRKSSKAGAKLHIDDTAYETCSPFLMHLPGRDLFFGIEIVRDNGAIYAEVR